MSGIRIPAGRTGPRPRVGEIEFLVHAECPGCHEWRCAVPGIGQMWPLCPLCGARVLPERNADWAPGEESGAFAYIGELMPEQEAYEKARGL